MGSPPPTPSMKGQTVLITGANSGIGREAAAALARFGATVVMTCRNPALGQSAMTPIRRAGGDVALLVGDHTSLAAVAAMAEEFLATHGRLDVLVNNAGGIFGPRQVTEDGFEYNFQINHLAHFLLTARLLDTLKASAPARIINVSSSAHKWGRMDFTDLQMQTGFSQFRAYGRAKLANVLFTKGLARRLRGTGVAAYSVHPGAVATKFGYSATAVFRGGVKAFHPFMLSARKGADTVVYLASASDLDGANGDYFVKRRKRPSSAESNDPGAIRKLWEVSESLVAPFLDGAPNR